MAFPRIGGKNGGERKINYPINFFSFYFFVRILTGFLSNSRFFLTKGKFINSRSFNKSRA